MEVPLKLDRSCHSAWATARKALRDYLKTLNVVSVRQSTRVTPKQSTEINPQQPTSTTVWGVVSAFIDPPSEVQLPQLPLAVWITMLMKSLLPTSVIF